MGASIVAFGPKISSPNSVLYWWADHTTNITGRTDAIAEYMPSSMLMVRSWTTKLSAKRETLSTASSTMLRLRDSVHSAASVLIGLPGVAVGLLTRGCTSSTRLGALGRGRYRVRRRRRGREKERERATQKSRTNKDKKGEGESL
jgi:hypothetical protein